MTAVSIEKCLLNIPNKFELSVLAMNRAKEILLNENITDIETTRFTKKCVNKSLKEIEEGKVNIDVLEDKIKEDLVINNMFLKESTVDTNTTDSEDDYDSVEINDDIDEIDEDIEDDISLDGIDIDDVEEDK